MGMARLLLQPNAAGELCANAAQPRPVCAATVWLTMLDEVISASAQAARLAARNARVAIVGMGYVGQPLAIAAHARGFWVTGFDIDPERVARLNAGHSSIRTVPDDSIAAMRASGRFRASSNASDLAHADVIVICVPTPLNAAREPDLSFVRATAHDIARVARRGQLICLESTTYPGTRATWSSRYSRQAV